VVSFWFGTQAFQKKWLSLTKALKP
jgi:hypothetical protein